MHAYALDVNLCTGCVEVLVLKFAQVAAIDSISPLATKLLHIEVVSTHTNLLVWIKSHANIAMLNLVMVAQPAHSLNNLGYASLVVGSEQSGSIGNDNVLADVSLKFWEFGRT